MNSTYNVARFEMFILLLSTRWINIWKSERREKRWFDLALQNGRLRDTCGTEVRIIFAREMGT